MRRSLTTLCALAAAAVAATPAQAQVLPDPAEPTPVAKSGKLSSKTKGGIATKKARFYGRGATILVHGRSTAWASGETVQLEVVRRNKVIATKTAPLRRKGRGGKYSFRFKAGKRGTLRLVVRHPGSATLAPMRAKDKRVKILRFSGGIGASGLKVLLLQRGLSKLGFPTSVSGSFDDATARAVTAFRKTNNLGRDGFATRQVFNMVLGGKGRYRLKYPKAGKHVEFDWSRQVLVLAKRGRAVRVYHSSSGTPATPTVFGSFRFYRQDYGTNSKGMVHSSYFIGGYAIHGYASVPNYPASHGCLRVPIPSAYSIYQWIDLGDPIFVYR